MYIQNIILSNFVTNYINKGICIAIPSDVACFHVVFRTVVETMFVAFTGDVMIVKS